MNIDILRVNDPIPVGTEQNFMDRFIDLLTIYARAFHWDDDLDPSTCLKLAQQNVDEYFNKFIGSQCSLEIKQKADASLRRQQKERGAL